MNLNLRAARALLLAAGLLLLASCGDDPAELATGQSGDNEPQAQPVGQTDEGDPAVPDNDTPTDADTPSDNDTPPDADTVPESTMSDGAYQRTESRLDLVSTEPAKIDQLAVGADDTTVFVRFVGAAEPCSGARVTTTETDTTVTVALETGLDPNAAAMTCIAQTFAYEIAVPLAAPLSTRELLAVPHSSVEPTDSDPFEGAEFPTDQYLGLTEVEATALGEVEQRVVRVARIDDEFFMLTEDFSPTRVNVEIEGGIVVVATSG